MPNTRKIELSLEEIDSLQFVIERLIGERGVSWDNTMLRALNLKLLQAGDDIYQAHERANNR